MKRRGSLLLHLLTGESGPAWQMVHRSSGENQGITGLMPFPCPVDPKEIIISFDTLPRPVTITSLRTWGADICARLFPETIIRELSGYDDGDILFMVPPEWADVPFEIFSLPNGLLGESFLVGTIIRTAIAMLPAKQHSNKGDMLIIADPSARLQSACAEGENLKNFAMKKKQPVRLLTQADREKLLADIPNASIVHFAGHSDAPPDSGICGWEVSNGKRFDAGDIREAGTGVAMPWLVFSNSCYGGSAKADAGLSGIAGAFLAAGVPQVIGPVCAVNDSAAANCSISFYEYLFKGMSAAQALRSMKRSFPSGPAGTAPLLYRLFGDPLYRGPVRPDFVEDTFDRHARKLPSLKKVILTAIAVLLLAVGIFVVAVNSCDPNSVIYIPAKEPPHKSP
jgi:hypothetical protein